MSTVRLTSKDNVELLVAPDVVRMSKTLADQLDSVGADALPVPDISGHVLGKVIEWCTHHREHPSPTMTDAEVLRSDNIPEWDRAFLDLDTTALFEVTVAADQLQIQELLELCCKTVANMIKDRSPDEVREAFKMP